MDNCGAVGKRGGKGKKRKVRKEFAIKFVRCQAETDGNEGGKGSTGLFHFFYHGTIALSLSQPPADRMQISPTLSLIRISLLRVYDTVG